jgi:GntR family transcriptional regulator/MocR family aminotransferase
MRLEVVMVEAYAAGGAPNKATSMPDSWTTLPTGLPRRRTLEQSLRSAIRDGRLPAGTRLPSTRALAQDLGLARGTVVESYAQLEAEGYIASRHGSGTWVADVTAPTPAPARRTSPEPALRFSFHPGLPDLTSFPHAAWAAAARRGLREAPAASLGYGDPRGRWELRAELAGYLARVRGAVADPELIVVCAGFRHGLSLLARVLAGRIAMEDPCLPEHRGVAAAAGLEVVPLPVDERGARTDLLAGAAAGAVVLSPAHQYPLGLALHPDRRAAAIAWARETGGLLIEDDYDAELRYDRQPVGALQALAPAHVAYGGTVSKTLAPGLRLGWLLLPPALLDAVVALRRLEDVHVSAPDQLAFTGLLRSGAYELHIRRMRGRYRARRDHLLASLPAAAAPVGIPAGLRVLLELAGADELRARAAERSLELFPLGGNYHDGRATRDGVVLGYAALAEHDFEPGVAALADLLR